MVEALDKLRVSTHAAVFQSPELESLMTGFDNTFGDIEQLFFDADTAKINRMTKAYGRTAMYLYKVPELPILFINNQPVLELFMFNIPKKQNKQEITELLRKLGPLDFTVRNLDKSGADTKVNIHCKNLATSLRLQTASVLHLVEVGFYSKAKAAFLPCKAKIRPDSKVYGLNRPVTDTQPLEFPEDHAFIKAEMFLPTLFSFIDHNSALNFTNALSYHPLALALLLNNFYDNSWPIFSYTNVKKFVKDHFTKHKPQTLIFNDKHALVNNDILKGTLRAIEQGCSREDAIAKREMHKIDLQSVALNRNVLEFLANKFSFKSATLGDFTSNFDSILASLQTQRLGMCGNSHLSGKFLANTSAEWVRMIECTGVSYQNMAAALENNKKIKVLIMHDCVAYDFVTRVDSLISAIFSGTNALNAVAVTWSRSTSFPRLAPDYRLMYNLACNIKFLDITNAKFFEPTLYVLLNSIPNVINLILTNLTIDKRCSFTHLKELKRLTLSWAKDVDGIFSKLPIPGLQSLNLVNCKKYPSSELDLLLPLIRAGVKVDLIDCVLRKYPRGLYLACKAGEIIVEKGRSNTVIYLK
uniref:Uncharacterized protein n=1 Tax=Trichogramma kaykai TaxID=54128 RepID=A0ABD2XSB7_9HYME